MFFTLAVRLLTSLREAISSLWPRLSGLYSLLGLLLLGLGSPGRPTLQRLVRARRRGLSNRIRLFLGSLRLADGPVELSLAPSTLAPHSRSPRIDGLTLLVEVRTEVVEELADRFAQGLLVLVGQRTGLANAPQELVLLGMHS